MVVFIVFVPLRHAAVVAGKLIVVDMRPNIVLLVFATNQSVLFFDKQALVVIPWIDITCRGVRRTLKTASFAGFVRIAESVTYEMPVVELRICRSPEIELTMVDVVYITQFVFAFVRRFPFVVDQ